MDVHDALQCIHRAHVNTEGGKFGGCGKLFGHTHPVLAAPINHTGEAIRPALAAGYYTEP